MVLPLKPLKNGSRPPPGRRPAYRGCRRLFIAAGDQHRALPGGRMALTPRDRIPLGLFKIVALGPAPCPIFFALCERGAMMRLDGVEQAFCAVAFLQCGPLSFF